MNCSDCGAELVGGAKFCSKCGAAAENWAAISGGPSRDRINVIGRAWLVALGVPVVALVVAALLVIVVEPFGDGSEEVADTAPSAEGPSTFPESDSRTAGQTPDASFSINVDDVAFSPDAISADAGEVIELVVTNTGTIKSHNLTVAGPDAEDDTEDDFTVEPFAIKPGETARVLVKIDEPGTYRFRCAFHPLIEFGTIVITAGETSGQEVVMFEPLRPPGLADIGVGPKDGSLAPDFEISDFDGTRYRLSAYRGVPVYINFWATWNIPSQKELPEIQELLDRHKGELVVITVNRAEPQKRAQDFFANVEKRNGKPGISFTVDGMDPDDTLYNEYRGLGMPVSVFIDRNGIVTSVWNGLINLEIMEEAYQEAAEGG